MTGSSNLSHDPQAIETSYRPSGSIRVGGRHLQLSCSTRLCYPLSFLASPLPTPLLPTLHLRHTPTLLSMMLTLPSSTVLGPWDVAFVPCHHSCTRSYGIHLPSRAMSASVGTSATAATTMQGQGLYPIRSVRINRNVSQASEAAESITSV